MSREEIYERLNNVFQETFDDDSITVNDETTSSDVDGWDSLMHISLIAAVEEEFGLKFKMKDVIAMKKVGDMVDIILEEV